MINEAENTILIAGLPGSGKSSFLAALSYLIESKEIPTELLEDTLPDDRTYINELVEKWIKGIEIGRTRIKDKKSVNLHLKSDSEKFVLKIPDQSGETWEKIWTDRDCTKDFVQTAKNCGGIILFLHCNDLRAAIPIAYANAMDDILNGGTPAAVCTPATPAVPNPAAPAVTSPKPWNAAVDTPVQAIAVDLLQLLANDPFITARKKLVIILSAWDLVEKNITPAQFLNREVPLLAQFLENQNICLELKVYGVSALGGDITEYNKALEEAEKTDQNIPPPELVSQDRLADRVSITDGVESSRDLTVPMKWLIT